MYNVSLNGLIYSGLDVESLTELLGEQGAISHARTEKINAVKAAAHTELSQYDWLYAREYRAANTDTPKPVPANISNHYVTVKAWADQCESEIVTLSFTDLDAYQITAPTL